MKIRLNKITGRLEIRTKKRMLAFHCDILKGSYYLVPTVRFDISGAYGEKSRKKNLRRRQRHNADNNGI